MVQATAKANATNDAKYDGYKKLLEDEDRVSLMARLVYAETAAANCPALAEKIAPLIAEAIGNRIRKRSGDVSRVVYQRNQFSSSLNIYTESRYREFLCPKDLALWATAFVSAEAELARKAPKRLSPDSVNYYLFKHSPRFKFPNWKLAEDRGHGEELRPCIRFFKVPKWR
ncbi:MAG TPA: hypothetical protein VFV50_02890 [Bdellovibrionales bacterium]|nr:hypothetical protein [Bdellovibrionales bacterium]